ncbi:hypothetical protein GGH12_002688 [Coemansia sp. RSA 1822]|nr:hypothetical protein LPJ76_002703 [Coemansia sp. RSA 638]KAJ2125175.1 hypothetical protein IW147_001074 [Coemansia sp. RSA 720]KAJ2542673.1 hypothetical protein GGF49_002700 [Coemansia sp. RSA 1853]KAJ2563268.1 hypothetical protein GGH12_002688 [Coemansia sp. RSA 1822]
MSTNNNDTSNKTTSGRPKVSWDDVMQSRQLLSSLTKEEKQRIICFKVPNYKEDIRYPSGRREEITSSALCFEKMSRQMSLNMERPERVNFWLAEPFMGAWVRQWQVVLIKGTPFVDRYMNMPWIAQRAAVNLFRSEEQREALIKIVPGDLAVRAAGKMVRDRVVNSMEPVKKSWEMVVKSVKDGEQLRLLGRCWEDAKELGALTLMASMAGSAASILSRLGKENDDSSSD